MTALNSPTTTTSTSTTRGSNSPSLSVVTSLYLKRILTLYSKCIGTVTPFIHEEISDSLVKGTPWEYFHYAITQTAYAPRPSAAYMWAIVRRLHRERVDPQEVSPYDELPY